MLTLAYFLLICWSLFWLWAWVAALGNELPRVRTGPRPDLFATVWAYGVPAATITLSALAYWGWLPATVYAAAWLANQ